MKRLPGPLYALVRRLMPIPCVDVLPHRPVDGGYEIGLIQRRSTASERLVWGLVGGRVRHGETLEEGIRRHMVETLGAAADWDMPDASCPVLAAEYSPAPRGQQLLDPRQHSVALTYVTQLRGDIRAGGEASDFRWFGPDQIPSEGDMVPGHDAVVRRLLDEGRVPGG